MSGELHFRTCNLCEAMCGLEILHEGGRVKKITGDARDSFSRGYHCIKGEALQDLHEDANRLRRPVRRTSSGWQEIGWDEAFNEVASNLKRIQKAHGRNSVASYMGNPNVHNYGSMIFLPEMLRTLRTKNRFSATSVDQLPHHMVAYFLFGHQLLLPVPDLDRTNYLLIFGGNPVVSRGSMMTAPDVTTRLKDIRERGGKVILFDPRRTETAQAVDTHYFIRPGGDAFVVLGMLKVIFAESLDRTGRLAAFVDGLDTVRAACKQFDLADLARASGVTATAIQVLAREFARAPAAAAYGRIGASTQEFGALTQWLLTVLNIATGNLDRPGGVMFSTPAVDPLPYISRGHFGKYKSRVRGLPEFGGELPTSVLAEEILSTGEGQIRALVTSAGNPVLSTPNGAQMERALAGLDYMVAIDPYINESTRFANIILPPSIGLEHENYDIAFHLLAIRNTTKFSTALFAPADGARHDWQIMQSLFSRLVDRRRKHPARVARRLFTEKISPERVIDLALRFGPYGSKLNPFGRGLTLKKLKAAPHGIDLGPLVPRLPGRLFTRNRRIDAAPEVFVKDLDRLAVRLREPKEGGQFDLLLIGRRQVRTNNSWMGHISRLTKGKGACTALINREDAAQRSIQNGDVVRVSSRVGVIELPAVVVDTIMRGVVSIPHGFGHQRDGVKMEFAAGAHGPSVNDLTDETFLDQLSGNAAFSGVPIAMERISLPEPGPAPAESL